MVKNSKTTTKRETRVWPPEHVQLHRPASRELACWVQPAGKVGTERSPPLSSCSFYIVGALAHVCILILETAEEEFVFELDAKAEEGGTSVHFEHLGK